MDVQIGKMVLLWFILFIGFYLLFYGLLSWLEIKVDAWRKKHKLHGGMNQSQLSNLLTDMNSLQADSFKARQALIRESFKVYEQQYDSRQSFYADAIIDIEAEQDK